MHDHPTYTVRVSQYVWGAELWCLHIPQVSILIDHAHKVGGSLPCVSFSEGSLLESPLIGHAHKVGGSLPCVSLSETSLLESVIENY